MPSNLSPRELDTLRAVLACGCVTEAAAELGIADGTVKAHLGGAYRRLRVDRLAEAVAILDDERPGWRPPLR